MTTRLIIAGVVLATVGLILFGRYLIVFRGFLPGYRGAIGFKNRSAVALTSVRLTGLSTVVEAATLTPGEHSFNYVARQALPAAVEITWRTPAADAAVCRTDGRGAAVAVAEWGRLEGATVTMSYDLTRDSLPIVSWMIWHPSFARVAGALTISGTNLPQTDHSRTTDILRRV